MTTDPCALENSIYENALKEMKLASDALDKANAKEVVPLQTEINKTQLEINRLKANGDPQSSLADLETLLKGLTKRRDAAKEKPEVKNANFAFNSAKAQASEFGSAAQKCKEDNAPKPPDEGDTPSSGQPDNGSGRNGTGWFRP